MTPRNHVGCSRTKTIPRSRTTMTKTTTLDNAEQSLICTGPRIDSFDVEVPGAVRNEYEVEERVRRKGRDFHKSKTGSILAFKVSFRDFNPLHSYIWFELYGAPSDRDVDLIGGVIQSWYVMGSLGAFNSANLQE